MSISTVIVTNEDEFKRIFGLELRQMCDSIFGLRVWEFDEILQTPDGTSTSQAVEARYGKEGIDLIHKILKEEAE